MFAILQITESERKLHNIFRKAQIESERINLPNGRAFFIVRLKKRRKNIPWKKLEKCLGILRHCVLLSENITVPDGINITVFTPDILPQLILINSATDYIINHKSEFITKNLTIYDKDGIYPNCIEKLISCFSFVKVITPVAEKYDHISRTLLENYGFSLIVSSDEKWDTDIVISPKCNVPVYFSGKLFTNQKKYLMHTEIFSGSNIELPDEYENICPANISRILFASALYEKCGVEEIGELRYIDFDG